MTHHHVPVFGRGAAASGALRDGSLYVGGDQIDHAIAAVGPGVSETEARVGQRVMNHHYAGCGRCKHCRVGWSQLCPSGITVFGVTGDGAHARYMKVPARTNVPLPDELTFIHAEDLLDMYPDLPRKQRETLLIQQFPAVFIIGIGWVLKDGYPHEMRAADYDDWVTPTVSSSGKPMHGLNGDILVWNHVTKRRHELTSMGIRVTKETLRQQLELSGQLDFLGLPYHQAILNDEIPLSIGGGIGQSRTTMLLLRKAHLGEVSVTVWPKDLKEICARKNIFVLE